MMNCYSERLQHLLLATDARRTAGICTSGPVQRRRLRLRLRAQCPGAQVIWYDAVTIDGALRWQDTLNAANRPFFDDCDGIFVNYTWKVSDLVGN